LHNQAIKSLKKGSPIIPYILITVFSFLILNHFVFQARWFFNHEKLNYFLKIHFFYDAFKHGLLYPRWLPDLHGGYGYPTFVFYQPGFFFLALLFSFVSKHAHYMLQGTVFSLFIIGGIGAYKLCELLSCRIFALCGTMLFLLTPYIYVNLFVRGDLSELSAILFTPWPFFLILKINQLIKSMKHRFIPIYCIGLGLSIAMIILCHPATGLIFVPTFCFVSLMNCFEGKKFNKILFKLLCLGLITGLTVSSPYWFTVLKMKKYVFLDNVNNGYYSFKDHFVYLKQFFSLFWDFGGSFPGQEDSVSFQLGSIHFILATIGFILNRKKILIFSTYATYLILLFLMLSGSSFIWDNIKTLQFLQFPWRILSVTAILQLILFMGCTKPLIRQKTKYKIIIVMLIICCTAFVHRNQFYVVSFIKFPKNYESLAKKNSFNFAIMNEFLPKTAKNFPHGKLRGNTPLVNLTPRESIIESKESTPYHIRYKISNKEKVEVTVNQLYFPGWRVILNNRDIPRRVLEKYISTEGLIQFPIIQPGNWELEAFYDGPPGWRTHTLIMGIVLFIIVIILKKSFIRETYCIKKIKK